MTGSTEIWGVELFSLEAARNEATKSAREIVAKMVLHQDWIDGTQFEILNEDGQLLATVPFREVVDLT